MTIDNNTHNHKKYKRYLYIINTRNKTKNSAQKIVLKACFYENLETKNIEKCA